MHSKVRYLRNSAFNRQGGRCCYCSLPMWLRSPHELEFAAPSNRAAELLRCTAEHLQAKSRGGKDVAKNIAAACWRCNFARHRRPNPPDPDAYRQLVQRRMAAGHWHDRWVHVCIGTCLGRD
jgi:hypothetical protein